MTEEGKIELLLVSGVSGAGKTTVASVAEEHGYYVIENIPAPLARDLLGVIKKEQASYGKTAIFVDLPSFAEIAAAVKADGAFASSLWGLDCSIDVLLSRYRLTRHTHPLQPKGYSLNEALLADARLMAECRPLFDVYIDTTNLTEKDLRLKAAALMNAEKKARHLTIVFSSFGYKYGLPRDAEVVIDARSLANPYWVASLSRLTGLDKPVIDFIEKDPHTSDFMGRLYGLLDDYFADVERDGRAFVNVDIGCTGGQHRSVYVAQTLYERYKNEYSCSVYHRELERFREDSRE
jgi:UPF0042 nucleotide-binding protein